MALVAHNIELDIFGRRVRHKTRRITRLIGSHHRSDGLAYFDLVGQTASVSATELLTNWVFLPITPGPSPEVSQPCGVLSSR